MIPPCTYLAVTVVPSPDHINDNPLPSYNFETSAPSLLPTPPQPPLSSEQYLGTHHLDTIVSTPTSPLSPCYQSPPRTPGPADTLLRASSSSPSSPSTHSPSAPSASHLPASYPSPRASRRRTPTPPTSEPSTPLRPTTRRSSSSSSSASTHMRRATRSRRSPLPETTSMWTPCSSAPCSA